MTRRGRAILILGLSVWIAAWLFGSRALFPVAAGLVLVVPLAVVWVRLSLQRPLVSRRWPRQDVLEGEDVRVELILQAVSRVPLPEATAYERIGRLGEHKVELRRERRDTYRGEYELRAASRGRHAFESLRVSVTDPWRLAESSLLVEEPEALVVYPRLVELEHLFSDGGAGPNDGRRLLLRRSAGFDLHSVREHQHGESLRRVHWPSTARAGVLMVKELEDAPRDELAVLLDCVGAGEPFEVAVRCAGSVLQAHERRGRRAALVLNAGPRRSERDFASGLELLAAVRPDPDAPVEELLAHEAAHAYELTVVTTRLPRVLVDALSGRRGAALV
jgi:uncharacterized protein (DUF58 family)